MSNVEFNWVQDQLDRSSTPQDITIAVLALLDKWEELGVSGENERKALDLFAKLAQGHAIVADKAEELWLEVQPGLVAKGDTVRVKADAFKGELGKFHNGRVGRVVSVRGGDVIMRSTDNGPLIDGGHYSPHALEKKFR